jgi:uncharacterized protein
MKRSFSAIRKVILIEIGKRNSLIVKSLSRGGCWLEAGDMDIYLEKKDLPQGTEEGDTIEVFVYNDAKESIKATTQTPLAQVGDFASLTIKDITSFGVFLDWGIDKDLFVPRKFITRSVEIGDAVVVRLILDFEGKGVLGTAKLDKYIERYSGGLEEDQEVDLLVYRFTELGAVVIVENRYSGLLYKNEIFEKLRIGESKTGYIKKIRDDGLLDVSLQRQGFKAASLDAREIVLEELKQSNGFLPFTDKSDPQTIRERLHISKKIFKKATGGLYKRGLIEFVPEGIRLVEEKSGE